MLHSPPTHVVQKFKDTFGAAPEMLIRAPGRVNLIGEHTDYSDGFVLPMAIDRAVWIAARRRSDRQVWLQSVHFDKPAAFSLDAIEGSDAGWAEYVKGMLWALEGAGHRLTGWEGILASDVPIGAGLSSSAALDLAVARTAIHAADLVWSPTEVAVLARKADNDFVGIGAGIMDQMIAANGKSGMAMLLDCRDLSQTHVPLPKNSRVIILDTSTRRGLVDSEYDERVQRCRDAANYFDVPALRDVTPEQFADRAGGMDPLTMQRARHVISENARTLDAAGALQRQDAAEFGRLMNASHESLRSDYGVSTHELDGIVQIARGQPGCYGARMTGAGFGGCAVALVAGEHETAFLSGVSTEYATQHDLTAQLYVCQPADGASLHSTEDHAIRMDSDVDGPTDL
jgi:galactokinase